MVPNLEQNYITEIYQKLFSRWGRLVVAVVLEAVVAVVVVVVVVAVVVVWLFFQLGKRFLEITSLPLSTTTHYRLFISALPTLP